MTEWGRYTLTVSFNGQVAMMIEYTGMSGIAMVSEAYSYRIRYPSSEGFIVEW